MASSICFSSFIKSGINASAFPFSLNVAGNICVYVENITILYIPLISWNYFLLFTKCFYSFFYLNYLLIYLNFYSFFYLNYPLIYLNFSVFREEMFYSWSLVNFIVRMFLASG